MPQEWYETVAHAQRLAQKRLPKSVYKALLAGSERGTTLEDNLAAFAELGFAPKVAATQAEQARSLMAGGGISHAAGEHRTGCFA